jgi:hypothetical protein
MVYVYYNLRLWVRQIQKTLDVDAILLNGIDTTPVWRVEIERPAMESVPDFLQEEARGGGSRGERGRGGGCSRVDTFTGGDY